MGYILSMALRNVGRNKRRSLLAIISVVFSILFTILTQGLVSGFLESMVKNYTKNETGHISITTLAFEQKNRFLPVTENISNPKQIIEKVRNDPVIAKELSLVTERINFGVLLDNRGNQRQALALSGISEHEKELLLLQKSIVPGGRYIEHEKEMIMGEKLAHSLHFALNDTVRVMAQGSDYALHLKKFVIVGIFRTGLAVLDDGMFQIDLSDAQLLLRSGQSTQQIIIMLKNYKKSEAVASYIRSIITDSTLSITPWTHKGEYPKMVRYATKVWGLLQSIVILLGSFIISNIMMMVVLERKKEIGILKSMGMRKNAIVTLFLIEGTLLGALGSVCGVVIGIALSSYFAIHGIDFSLWMKDFHFPIDNRIYFQISIKSVVVPLVLGTLIAALVSLLPAQRASKMNAIDAIKSL